MNKYDMPYERYVLYGPSNLTDLDLLAIILRSGSMGNSVFDISHSILNMDCVKSEGLSGLFGISESDLCSLDGIGKIKASQIICIIELAKRLYTSKAFADISFENARKIADYYMYKFKKLQQEQIVVIYLNTKLKMIADETISIGTINSSIISPREIYIRALKQNAVYIILIHNHPSGDSTPSSEDKAVTLRLKNCGEMLQIPLLDHIVIGDDNYFSMKEHGFI